MSAKTAIEFAAWLKRNHPGIYQKAKAEADRKTGVKQMAGLGEDDAKQGWFSSFLEKAAAVGSTYLNLKNQRDALKLNIERAQAGMPPVDIETTPTLKTQVELPPDVVDKISASAGLQVNKLLLFGGLGLAAFMLLR